MEQPLQVINLVYLCEHFGLYEVANFWNSVVTLNNWHQKRISQLITKKLFGSLSNKIIIVLGFSFKANTNDTRESAAIQICKDLLDEGAILKIHDPQVNINQIEKDLNSSPTIFNPKAYEKESTWNKVTDLYSSFNNAICNVIVSFRHASYAFKSSICIMLMPCTNLLFWNICKT